MAKAKGAPFKRLFTLFDKICELETPGDECRNYTFNLSRSFVSSADSGIVRRAVAMYLKKEDSSH